MFFEGYLYLANQVLDFLVLLFVISGVAKLLDRLLFKHTLMMLPFMTGGLARLTSVMLPTGELLLALALYCNFKIAKLAAVVLLLSSSWMKSTLIDEHGFRSVRIDTAA